MWWGCQKCLSGRCPPAYNTSTQLKQSAKTYDNCRRHLPKTIVTCLLACSSSTQSKQSAKTYDDCSGRHLLKTIVQDVSFPKALQLSRRSPQRHAMTVVGGISSKYFCKRCHLLACNISTQLTQPAKTYDSLEALRRALHLPRKVTLAFHQALHLPRKVTLELHQILRLPRKVTLALHEVLHLPRKVSLMLNPHDIWNLIYNARSNSCPPPTSPNTAPATQNSSRKFLRKSLKTDVKRHFQCGADSSRIRAWSEHNPRIIRP